MSAAIRHTVVFRLYQPPGSAACAVFLAEAHRVLAAIPVVHDFTVSRQVSGRSEMEWQFSMRFATEDDYQTYNAHHAHRRFVDERWAKEVAGFQEYDFAELDGVGAAEQPAP